MAGRGGWRFDSAPGPPTGPVTDGRVASSPLPSVFLRRKTVYLLLLMMRRAASLP